MVKSINSLQHFML